jgi:hypothetical protein
MAVRRYKQTGRHHTSRSYRPGRSDVENKYFHVPPQYIDPVVAEREAMEEVALEQSKRYIVFTRKPTPLPHSD